MTLESFSQNLSEIKQELLIAINLQPVQKDILIVVHDQLDYLKCCVESIQKNTENYKIYIWDNASDQETQDYLKQLDAVVYRSEENEGFIKPNNYLAKISSSPYLILLNSDTIVERHWDTSLIGWLETHGVELVGYGGGILDENFKGGGFAQGYKPDYICGWCLCLSRKIYQEIGLFDDQNLEFAYGEDADLSLRVKEKGGKIYSLYSRLVNHIGNVTVKQVSMEKGVKSMESTFAKNHAYLKRRWANLFTRRPR